MTMLAPRFFSPIERKKAASFHSSVRCRIRSVFTVTGPSGPSTSSVSAALLQAGSRALLPMDDGDARTKALAIDAKVLSNRKPPYSLCGGVYDALCDAGGDIELATNEDIKRCQAMFAECEGVDIHPAAAVALQGMINAVKAGKIERDAVAMLNVTGGGEQLCRSTGEEFMLEPAAIMSAGEKDVILRVEKLFE